MGAQDVVYFDSDTNCPVGVRVAGQLLPVSSGTEISVSTSDTSITRVGMTLLLPGLRFEFVASEEAEALRSEVSFARGGAR